MSVTSLANLFRPVNQKPPLHTPLPLKELCGMALPGL
jgi:hypothetical protein